MPSQTNVYVSASPAKAEDDLLAFVRSRIGSKRSWIGQSTVRAFGENWSSKTGRGADRRPVLE